MEAEATICPECGKGYSEGETFCPVDGARLSEGRDRRASGVHAHDSDPLLGETIEGRYRIVRRIGEGGMGIVYEAEHVTLKKRVALKLLRDDFSGRSDVVERFLIEAQSASQIGHEHIIETTDFGQIPGGGSYFVMEFLAGRDLAEELEEVGPLDDARAIGIALQCARALGAAHAKGIVHRDMKPENIFLKAREDGSDFVKIVDFGIAKMSDLDTDGEEGRKLTKTGMIFGTPDYMAPEQASGQKVDRRVDIYAMGVILYELVCGRVPFDGDSFMGVLMKHMHEPPPPMRTVRPDGVVSPVIEQVIMRALAKSPDERFQSMEELATVLESLSPHALSSVPGGLLSGLPSQPAGSGVPPQQSTAPPPGTVTHHGAAQPPSGAYGIPTGASQGSMPPQGSMPQGSMPQGSMPQGSMPQGSMPQGSMPHGSFPHGYVPGQTGPVGGGPSYTGGPGMHGYSTVGPMHAQTQTSNVKSLLIGGLAIGALVVAGVFFVMRGSGTSHQASPPVTSVEPTLPVPAPSPAVPAVPASAVPGVPAVPTPPPVGSTAAPSAPVVRDMVPLTIKTKPEGARVYIDGEELPERTPCTVSVRRGRTIALKVKLGKATERTRTKLSGPETINFTLKQSGRRKRRQAPDDARPRRPAPGENKSDLRTPKEFEDAFR